MSVDDDISIDLLGKSVSDLQSGIEIGDDGVINGTLKYVSDYTGFSGDSALQSGNYLALHFDAGQGATIKLTLTDEKTLDADGIAILRISDKSTQTITVVASKPGAETVTKVYSLTGLTCEEGL